VEGDYRKSSHVIYRLLNEDVIILDMRNDTSYILEGIGAKIWKWLIEDKRSLKEITEEICKSYEVSREKFEADLAELLEELLKKGLVEKLTEKKDRS
jgi:hypothetical protein